jgi:hypothetical protein
MKKYILIAPLFIFFLAACSQADKNNSKEKPVFKGWSMGKLWQ